MAIHLRHKIEQLKNKQEGASQASPEARLRAVECMRELSRGVRLERSGVTLREYAHLGHRY